MNILVINGPNLNMLGNRDSDYYGTKTLSDALQYCRETSEMLGVSISSFQSNSEGDIIKYIQDNVSDSSGIIINAGALTHYGLSIRDALIDSKLPLVEVHLSNIQAREEYRRHSVISDIAVGQIVGLGWQGYVFALEFLVPHVKGSR